MHELIRLTAAVVCVSIVAAWRADCVASDFLTEQLAEVQARASNDVRSLRVSLDGTVRIVAGSYNSVVDLNYPGKRSNADLPESDVVVPVFRDVILDFSKSRTWTKGVSIRGLATAEEDGSLKFRVVADPSEAAYDGRLATGLNPKESRDPLGILPGTRYPVEFYEIDTVIKYDNALFPLFAYAGHLPNGHSPPTSKDMRPRATAVRWAKRQDGNWGGHPVVVAVSEATASGAYVEAMLQPEYNYRPLRWSLYSRTGIHASLEIKYAEDAPLGHISSWTSQQYGIGHELVREEAYSVILFEVNTPMNDAGAFRLKPVDGMVIERILPEGVSFEVAGRPDIKARTHYEVQDAIDAPSWGWYATVAVAAGLCIASAIALLFRRLTRFERVKEKAE